MEAFGVLKSRRNDVIFDGGGSRNADGDEDSFFDLVFKSPDRVAVRQEDEAEKKDFRFVESRRGVLLSKIGFSNSKDLSPVTLLRSTPKFKVFFMFNFRKPSKCEKKLSSGDLSSKSTKIDESNRFSVNCRVEEATASSIMTRDSNLRSQMLKETSDCEASSEKSNAIPKYLKLIKPLYLKVWKRKNEKTKLTDSLTPLFPHATAPVKLSPMKFPESSRAGRFKIATKRLRKSRSASAAVGMPLPPARRRDDSLLEQHDGIQGAVLYCKKSYNSSSEEISQLFRSSSDPSHEKLGHQGRHSCVEESIRCSI